MKKIAFILLTLFLTGSAHAVSITYEGMLTAGVTQTGQVQEPDGGTNNDFWSFFATVGDSVSVTAIRIDSGLDTALRIYEGTYADDSLFPSPIEIADDEIANPGPYGDPLAEFTASITGFYTAEVWSFISSGDGPFDYEITVRGNTGTPSAVPLPAAVWLFGSAIAGFAGFSRFKKKA